MSTNPYFISTSFSPIFSLFAVGAQGPCRGREVGCRTTRGPSRHDLAVWAPLQKVSEKPYFYHTTFLPLFSHSPEHALGGRAEGVSDTRRHKRERCPQLSAELAPSSLPGALPPTRRPQRRRFYHRPPSVAPAPSRQRQGVIGVKAVHLHRVAPVG